MPALPRNSKTAIFNLSTALSKPFKRLEWVASSKKDMRVMPEVVKDVFGSALLDAQYGESPLNARAFGEGLPGAILKLAEDHYGNTYRVAFTTAFADVVYVLDVFVKKSKTGIRTPTADKARVLARYKAAKEHYEAHYTHRSQ